MEILNLIVTRHGEVTILHSFVMDEFNIDEITKRATDAFIKLIKKQPDVTDFEIQEALIYRSWYRSNSYKIMLTTSQKVTSNKITYKMLQ